MQEAKKLASISCKHLSLIDKSEDDNFSDKVLDEEGEPVFARHKDKVQSGVREKVVGKLGVGDSEYHITKPRSFLTMFHYHYPVANFSKQLSYELRELESFFEVLPNQRGEGTVVVEERLLSAMTYRMVAKPVVAKAFSKAIEEVLKRHGVEIIKYQIDEA